MAITTDAFDATELQAFISETWTPMVMEEYFAKPVAADFFRDLSEFAQSGSDIFHVPDVFTNSFSVQSQGTQGGEVTTEAPATNDVTMTIDNHKYIATLLGDKDRVQIANSYNINEVYSRKMGGTLAEDLEDALFGEWSNISTNTVGDTATVLSDAEIRQGVEKLLTADYPMDEMGFFFHPFTYMVQLLAVQKYYDVSQFARGSSTMGVTMEGTLTGEDLNSRRAGQLYGIPVYLSSRIVSGLQTHRNILAHRDAFGYAHQQPGGGRVRMQTSYELTNLGQLVVADTIYGTKTLREEAAVLLNANSSFINS